MESLEIVEKSSNLIDREKEKKAVRPYRKYQLMILLFLIVSIIQICKLYSLNKELSQKMNEFESLLDQYFDEKIKEETLTEITDSIDINYEYLYGLDKQPNIDTIKSVDELFLLYSFISPNASFDDISLTMCYKATSHGDTPDKFRDYCGGVAPLYVIIETTDGYRFGGFTNVPFSGDGELYKRDENAFLFSFDTKKKYPITNPDKAIFDSPNVFPEFGEHDISISSECLSNTKSMSSFPKSYEGDKDFNYDYILTGGVRKFQVKEMEAIIVYMNEEIDDLS